MDIRTNSELSGVNLFNLLTNNKFLTNYVIGQKLIKIFPPDWMIVVFMRVALTIVMKIEKISVVKWNILSKNA